MQIVYIHGLDSDSNAEKGQLLADYCAKHFPQIKVVIPDLNLSPQQAIKKLQDYIAEDPDTGLVGSSLGGFYATMMSNLTGNRVVLLNPSTDVGNSLKRFFPKDFDALPEDYVGHTTVGGWDIRKSDIEWFIDHRPSCVTYPDKVLLIVKMGDELLDYQQAVDYYSQTQAGQNGQCHIIIEEGGEHQMKDFNTKLAQVVQFLFGLPEVK